MHGPGDLNTQTYPTNLDWAPSWPGGRIVEVVDTLALTLRPLRRAVWRKARDKALRLWEPAGMIFRLSERDASAWEFPGFTGLKVGESESCLLPGKLRIARSTYNAPADTYYPISWAWWTAERQGACVFFKPNKHFWQGYWFGQLVANVCHELGHCLGLSHGGGGVMSGALRPNEHDLDSVRRYYS